MELSVINGLPGFEVSESDAATSGGSDDHFILEAKRAFEIANARDDRAKAEIPIMMGGRLKRIRIAKGMSQQQLADKCNISYQQVQKYEKALNAPSIRRMIRIAEVLEFDPVKFLAEIINHFTSGKVVSDRHSILDEALDSRGGAEMVRLFTALPQKDKTMLLRLARHLADADV